MSNYDDSGILFKNKEKKKDTHPDHQGSATIDGIEYWMSAWVKKGAQGSFMTFSFKPKEQKQHSRSRQYQQPQQEEFDDDIPF